MIDPTIQHCEAVGRAFSVSAMLIARDLTFEAVRHTAEQIRPGMNEVQARDLAEAILARMGMERLWHKIIVRFGVGTTHTFDEPLDADRILGVNDIFFIDLGVVWDGHEGDAGDTFVVGDDAEKLACAQAAKALWHEVAARWHDNGLTGEALYQFALSRAQSAGWRLNWEVKGHRVSDFPHAIYKAGSLGDLEIVPAPSLWILEIQLAHSTKPFGAFYEDLLQA